MASQWYLYAKLCSGKALFRSPVKLFFAILVVLPVLLSTPGAAGAELLRIPLYKLAPAKTIDLKCVYAEFGLKIPVPQRWNIKKAVLNFDYVNSTGLLANQSRMVIKVNDTPLAQVNLNPLTPEGSVRLSIPPGVLEEGYNNLTFVVSQHYRNECEQPCASDMWTTLKLDAATVEIEYSRKAVPMKLSSVPNFLFDPTIAPEARVNLVLESMEADMVTLASVVASGVARRFDYRKVAFSTSKNLLPGYDNILIANADYAQKFLAGKGYQVKPVTAPTLKIFPMIDKDGRPDPQQALLVISGQNTDQTKLAAETFSIMSSSFPDADEMIATSFTLPDISMYGGRLVLTEDKKLQFKDLDFFTETLKGVNPPPKDIVFRLPSDFHIKPNLYADVVLYFAYGAALRSDSVLNISVNDNLIRGIHLDNIQGGVVEGYKLSIPAYMFKPGTNVLRFQPVLTPSPGKNCENIQAQNLFLTIFENSTIYFPPMPHFVDLPRLELFTLNGFPITRWPDGHQAMIYLANKDYKTISAALNLVGLMTQKNGYPVFETKLTYEEPKKFDGELMIVGTMDAIPVIFREKAPLKIAKDTVVPYPVVRSWKTDTTLAYSKQKSSLASGKGLVMEFESPYVGGRTVLLFSAASTDDLVGLSEAMLDPGVQAKLEGDLAMVDLTLPNYSVSSMKVGKPYFTGTGGKVSSISAYLHANKWLYYVAVAVVILLLSLSVFFLLNRYRQKRIRRGAGKGAESHT